MTRDQHARSKRILSFVSFAIQFLGFFAYRSFAPERGAIEAVMVALGVVILVTIPFRMFLDKKRQETFVREVEYLRSPV